MSSGVDKIIKFLGFKSNSSPVQSCVGVGCQQSHDHQNGTTLQTTSTAKQEPQIEYELTNDQKIDLSRKTQVSTRLKTIKDLEELVECHRLVDYSVKYIITETADLLEDNQPKDVRHTVWNLYQCLISGRADRLSELRPIFWNLIEVNNSIDEDIHLRLKLLIALTDNGKHNESVETKIAPIVTNWFDKIFNHFHRFIGDYLTLVLNLIKSNSSHLEQKTIAIIIDKTYGSIKRLTTNEELMTCYQIMDAIVCYSTIPFQCLTHFVIVLCNGVKTTLFNDICLKVMRNLLNTHLGHSSVDTLRYLLNDQTNHEDINLLVGAIFFLSNGLWDQTRIKSLKHSPNAILPAFKSVLQCRHPTVALEVSLSLICLVENQNNIIVSDHTWDQMFDICEDIINNYEICVQNSGQELDQKFHMFLDIVEEINDKKQFFGDTNRLFNVLEKCSLYRSEQSGRRLIQYRAQSINPMKENWIESLKYLIETYYKKENRTFVRIQALDILSEFVRQYRYIHEEIIFESIIIPYLNNVDQDSDVECRQRAVQLIVDIAKDSISAKRCLELLDILDRVCKRPFEASNVSAGNKNSTPSDNDAIDVKFAIKGLILIFKSKLFTVPGLTAIQAFKLIVSHLSAHYTCVDYNSSIGQIGSVIKQEIFDLLLSIRANSSGQIGVYTRTAKSENTPKHSLFIVCERNNQISPNTSTSASPVVSATTTPQTANPLSPPLSPILHSVNSNANNLWTLSFKDLFNVLIICLRNERDWTVLKLVLNALPKFFKNKAIILSGSSTVAIDLCNALCSLINEMPTKLILPNDQKLSKAEFQSFVYPSLSAMVGYQNELEFRQQCLIIKCLQNGLVSVSGKTSVLRQCILSLTICAVEMLDPMTKCLPETLLSLSKISATVPLSIPKLEFLSNVILLPRLYQSFTMDQYMSVFAIALPYTNPFKFNEYTVALAHRVIAIWFLKCRLPCRKSIVPYIIKGLQTNVIQEELNHSTPYSDAQRLRSSSLNTEQQTLTHKKLEARLSLQSSPPPMPSTPHSSHSHFSFSFSNDTIAQHSNQLSHHSSQMSNINENEFQEFRHELVETCMDMLANYTFGMCSTVPLKSPMVEPLLDRSKSETWIVGHKLITITTSGCGSRAVSNGLCEKCLNLCRNDENIDSFADEIQTNNDVFQSSFESKIRSDSTTSTDSDKNASRRRHQSEIGHILRPQSTRLQSGAYDDSFLKSFQQKPSSFAINTTTLCSCWCQGWAEINIRRPTGVSSWILRLQNALGNVPYSSSPPDELPDLTALMRPNRTREPSIDPSMDSQTDSDSKQNSFDLNETENDVFKRGNSSPQTEDSPNNLNPFNFQNGAENQTFFKPVESPSPLVHPIRTSPFQPVAHLSRAQSFGSRIRGDFRARLLDKKEFRSNDLESNIDSFGAQRYPLSRDSSGDSSVNSKTPGLSPRIKNEAESMTGPRDRVHTISVMSPVNLSRRLSKEMESSYSFPKSSGLCPKFVFLQLYYNSMIEDKCPEIQSNKDFETHNKTKPILLPKNDSIDRSLKNLDRITPYETHKIGVLYVGPDQAKDKTAIWSNSYGSSRYIQFIRGLGKMIRLEDADSQVSYVGGLDVKKGGQDGKYAIAWEDNLIQVIFHVATLMPTKVDTDPNCNNKKRHIGNDYVCIVYNESGSTVNISTIKGDGQFIQAIVVITPFEYNSNLVMIQAKDDFLNWIGHYDSQMLSDNALPVYVRQLALHANLGSMIYNGTQSATSTQTQHVSNWVQRLKQIKRIRQRVTNRSAVDSLVKFPGNESNEDTNSGANPQTGDIKSQYIFPDFNDYS